tara:strand:- start:14256 stop:16169 length:1914 start_codon:yes stop_codon:yes gene_type:complete
MNKKSKIAKSSWWIFAIIGIIVHLSLLDFEDKWILVLIGALNGAFWGWLLGLLLDYIINSLFYREPIEEITEPVAKQQSSVSKFTNHKNHKPKASEYTSIKKEEETITVSEPIAVFKSEKKIQSKSEKKLEPPKIAQTEKQKKKETLPNSVKEVKKPISDIKYVNYVLKISESETDFPILKIPNQKCVVRSHRFGSTKRRGFKEASFQKAIEHFFSDNFQISGNTRLNTGKETRPFEPDIAMLGKGIENIRIDIEIDEPYAGITRQPTHCVGDDINRDNYFKDRGWIVIRFSEYQVHTQEKECLKFIANLLSKLNSSIEISNELKSIAPLRKEKVWDIVQAQKWEKEKYREKYLNHEFKILEEQKETLKRGFDEQEIEEEKYVIATSFGKEDNGKIVGFNNLNKHKRDNRIKFYSEKHIYTIDGVPAPSASTIINRFFPEFDMEYWSARKAPDLGMTAIEVAKMWGDKGKIARDKGTLLHEQIENYYLGIDYIETEEFDQFRDFLNDHIDLKPYRSEWRIFDDTLNIAGTIDLIVTNGTKHDIYDWKRSKKVVNTFDGQPTEQNQWQQGVGGLSHIDDTSYNRYCLQQSLYKYILEKNYNFEIGNMYLIVMYPENDNYYKVNVPYLENEIEYILKTV